MYFCKTDKVIVVLAIGAMFLLVLQIILHFMLGYSWTKFKMKIFYLCFVLAALTFVNFGFFKFNQRQKLMGIFDMFRFTIFFLIFYFFLRKPSDHLDNKAKV